MIRQAYIYDAVRTAKGKGHARGALYRCTPSDLVKTTLQGLVSQYPAMTRKTDQIVVGCSGLAHSSLSSPSFHKSPALESGFSKTVSSIPMNNFLCGGLESIAVCSSKIMSGMADLMIATSVDTPSHFSAQEQDFLFHDPTSSFLYNIAPQGIMADLLASERGYSRSNLEEFSVLSHQKAHNAHIQEGLADKNIIPVKDINQKIILDKDEALLQPIDTQSLIGLPSAFQKQGQSGFEDLILQTRLDRRTFDYSHTTATTAFLADGASAVVIGSKGIGKYLGTSARGIIRSFSSCTDDAYKGFTSVIQASEKALKLAELTRQDIHIFEVHETFSAVGLMIMEDLNIHPDQFNPMGGSLATGNCLSASAGMMILSALDTLEHQDKTFALITVLQSENTAFSLIIERI